MFCCEFPFTIPPPSPQHIVHSMKDPSIAAFWLITFPQIVGGFEYDDEVKQKIWWQYKVLILFDLLIPGSEISNYLLPSEDILGL